MDSMEHLAFELRHILRTAMDDKVDPSQFRQVVEGMIEITETISRLRIKTKN